ncbi:MAG: hypothetical protein AAFY26_24970, partial [Cyanobacteria bacterium J06638_22]
MMQLDNTSLQALRECCRDEAAFHRLCEVLSQTEAIGLAQSLQNNHPPASATAQAPEQSVVKSTAQRYRAMLDAVPDLMFRIDETGRYIDFKG